MTEFHETCEELRSRAAKLERGGHTDEKAKDEKARLKEVESLRKAAAERRCI